MVMQTESFTKNGAVAAGHSETAKAGAEILLAGGNAFDAIIAAQFVACVAEPVLASLGGGGFLLAQTAGQQQLLLDFFVQTPKRKRSVHELDFEPILADFGETQQEFHVGLGSVATPGSIKGMFELHQRLGHMPFADLVQPAIKLAKEGVPLNQLQAYIYGIVSPILMATPEARSIFSDPDDGQLLKKNQLQRKPELADTMDALANEGADLFYRGEIAQRLATQSQQGGGHLSLADLESYRVICREPLRTRYRGAEILMNPPPSSGGVLIAFALQLLEELEFAKDGFGSFEHLSAIVDVMGLTNQARIEAHIDEAELNNEMALLNPDLLERYKAEIIGRARAMRGTTHMSAMDRQGNVATMTLSNGEGCGHILTGTGIMLNNMLGEEDLNPRGFHQWRENQRMTSMMAPTLINRPNGEHIALGSGGSNRIRTAILQTIINILDFKMPLPEAVESPRLHFENELLNIEAGFDSSVTERLAANYTNHKLWAGKNLFFGGVHAVSHHQRQFNGMGDQRRGGESRLV